MAVSLAPCVSAFVPSRVSTSQAFNQYKIATTPRRDVKRSNWLNIFLGSNESSMEQKKANPSKAAAPESVKTEEPTVQVAEPVEEESKEGSAAEINAEIETETQSEAPEAEPVLPENSDITMEEVKALFGKWNDALATGDSSAVANRYTKSPVLLATVSDTPRTDFDSVKDYFDSFLKKEPQGKIVQGFVNVGEGWASDTGVYEFTMGATGDVVKARYSFVYVKEDGEYKIQHHHSSVMPEGIAGAEEITEDEVRDLFQLWNGALATLEPKNVADRYAKKAVLLPTVSDIPRTDYDSIQDYFVNFLKLQPQGEILESNVSIGFNWAQDCGK